MDGAIWVGPIAIAVALLEGAIFLYPIVLAVLPGTLVRILVTTAFGACLNAAVLVALLRRPRCGDQGCHRDIRRRSVRMRTLRAGHRATCPDSCARPG